MGEHSGYKLMADSSLVELHGILSRSKTNHRYRFTKSHSDADNLANYFNFSVANNLGPRERMSVRLQDNFVLAQRTPATDVSFARFHKVNWSFIFRAPAIFDNFVFDSSTCMKPPGGKIGYIVRSSPPI
jgi:hypothetical protein